MKFSELLEYLKEKMHHNHKLDPQVDAAFLEKLKNIANPQVFSEEIAAHEATLSSTTMSESTLIIV